jgi:hypothetical protein
VIEEKLDFVSRQFGQLKITERLPDGVPSNELFNRAMDVKSAAFIFLAVQIRYESRQLGVVGSPPLELQLTQEILPVPF